MRRRNHPQVNYLIGAKAAINNQSDIPTTRLIPTPSRRSIFNWLVPNLAQTCCMPLSLPRGRSAARKAVISPTPHRIFDSSCSVSKSVAEGSSTCSKQVHTCELICMLSAHQETARPSFVCQQLPANCTPCGSRIELTSSVVRKWIVLPMRWPWQRWPSRYHRPRLPGKQKTITTRGLRLALRWPAQVPSISHRLGYTGRWRISSMVHPDEARSCIEYDQVQTLIGEASTASGHRRSDLRSA